MARHAQGQGFQTLQNQPGAVGRKTGAKVTQAFPANPNGSPDGIAGLTSRDGRATLMMPHPERVFRTVQLSWAPAGWGEDSPWLRLFRNARAFVG